jgi:lysyl endopeptidase
LTANHCVSTFEEAASITSLWFYEAPACGGLASGNQVQLAGGAALAFTNYMADSTLLRLNGTPPSGTVFAGFNAAPMTKGTAITAISHPTGDIMKFATGSIVDPVRTVSYPQDFNTVKFDRGVTEGGSSGSGLFTLSGNSLQLRGILSGTTVRESGGLKCGNTKDVGLYGRFDLFYPQIQATIENAPAGFPFGDIDANQPGGTARAINFGTIDAKGSATGSITASINYAGDLDVFRINVPQDGHLTVFSTGGKDLVGALLTSTGAGLEASDGYTTKDDGFDFGITRRVAAGTYFLSVGHFDATGTGDYGISTQFSTATDNYTDLWWNTPEESGWGININHQGNTLFATLFTYETGGAGLWLVMSDGARQADGSYKGDLYRTTGSAFNAVPFNPAMATKVGNMSLRFADKNRATLVYDFEGKTVTKTITRQVFKTQPVCTFSAFDRTYAFNYQDLWWNPAESGWGVNVTHQDKVLFATLFNYDAAGKGLWLVMSNGQEISRTLDNVVYQGDLYRTTGPAFNTTPWTAIGVTAVGKMKFDFTGGNSGTLTYDVNGITVVKKIERQLFGVPATSCDQP